MIAESYFLLIINGNVSGTDGDLEMKHFREHAPVARAEAASSTRLRGAGGLIASFGSGIERELGTYRG